MIITPDELGPLEIIIETEEEIADQEIKLAPEVLKSLRYMNNQFEFIERDDDGIKVRVRSHFLGGEFPFEVGYTIISDYDDRKFIITKIEQQYQFVWFGTWED